MKLNELTSAHHAIVIEGLKEYGFSKQYKPRMSYVVNQYYSFSPIGKIVKQGTEVAENDNVVAYGLSWSKIWNRVIRVLAGTKSEQLLRSKTYDWFVIQNNQVSQTFVIIPENWK
ncbi:MAG: hypothetical protein IJG38_01880 [Thermoguttaceae bacterium]|nr:hypothetical protein [Thermoguttaceae bacterium]